MAVHRAAHDLCEQEPRSAHHAADGDQQRVSDRHASDCACHTGERIEQGDRNRHVSSADADGKRHAKETAAYRTQQD